MSFYKIIEICRKLIQNKRNKSHAGNENGNDLQGG